MKNFRFKIKDLLEFLVYCEVNMTFEELVKHISNKLNLKTLKAVRCKDFIKDIVVVTGFCYVFIRWSKADCFLTGDIKYHDAMEAKARNISLIDIRHYESEKYFNKLIEELLLNIWKK